VRAAATSSAQQASSSTAAAAAQAAEAPKPLHVTVNGRAAEVPAGSSLYDAVAKVGAFVPVLCKHPRLPNTPGSCRCAVSGPPHACAEGEGEGGPDKHAASFIDSSGGAAGVLEGCVAQTLFDASTLHGANGNGCVAAGAVQLSHAVIYPPPPAALLLCC
jgi:hypothetical protein